ncbi:MAG: PIG-L deacetylase family protein [Ferrimicrobium sp.]|jgi:LmbE family N-acetylglucosaminyl deacetylase|uniref:PIG-L deacetylase family protein n=1 Tax=Ferrimicrobium acidiphilum TaxID=121039 RepID=A0ABV3Y724_9ACTN|nr:PIG-L deacetylase family protein [Ferrimicrobium sp.]MCL5973460.1 PIG-L family deacetylase [Actinomycetota bacterium]
MSLTALEPTKSVLVVTAHPDDVDFGIAGTIAAWRRQGTEIAYCIVTDGDAGGFDPSIPRSQIPSIRRREQVAAAKSVGVDTVEFLGYHDGSLEVSMQLRHDITAMIRRFQPERVLCQSPVRNFARIGSSHPDHLAAGEATLCAVYPDARNPFTHQDLLEQGLEAHTVLDVALMAYPDPTHYVDVTDTFEAKIEAIKQHKSQLPDPGAMREMVRGWLGAGAASAGLPEGRLAEMFFLVQTA